MEQSADSEPTFGGDRERRILHARLMIITDTTIAPRGDLERRIETLLGAAQPGSIVVQVRDRQLPVRERLSLGRAIAALCKRYDHWFIVNDRCDLAVILGADGVHLGESAVSALDARRVLGSQAWISCAVHDPALGAPDAADAVLLSPIFAARKGKPALGATTLTTFRHALDAENPRTRLFALGGVDESCAIDALSAGANGVAVIGAALNGRDPRALLRALSIAR